MMAKRMILMLAVVITLLAGLGFVKYRQIQAAVGQNGNFQPAPEPVTTIVAQRENWPSTLNIIGTAEAIQGVTVSADLPGTVARINFESGKAVHTGDVLVELDTRQERAQLAAAEAQRDLAGINSGRTQELVKQGVMARTQNDNINAQQKDTATNMGQVRRAIRVKTS